MDRALLRPPVGSLAQPGADQTCPCCTRTDAAHCLCPPLPAPPSFLLPFLPSSPLPASFPASAPRLIAQNTLPAVGLCGLQGPRVSPVLCPGHSSTEARRSDLTIAVPDATPRPAMLRSSPQSSALLSSLDHMGPHFSGGRARAQSSCPHAPFRGEESALVSVCVRLVCVHGQRFPTGHGADTTLL